MFNLDVITIENNAEDNSKWLYIPDHPSRILIIEGSESRKKITLLDLIREQDSIDKIYWYAKDLNEPKHHQSLIKKSEEARMCLDKPNPISFLKYSNTLNDVYNNIDDYNPKSTDLSTNKKFHSQWSIY